jgi:hypothetical protein
MLSEVRTSSGNQGHADSFETSECTVAHERLDWAAEQHHEPLKERTSRAEDDMQFVPGSSKSSAAILRHHDGCGCSCSRWVG